MGNIKSQIEKVFLVRKVVGDWEIEHRDCVKQLGIQLSSPQNWKKMSFF